MWAPFLLAQLLSLGACSFDDSRLDQLRDQGGLTDVGRDADLGEPDLPPDGAGDVVEDPDVVGDPDLVEDPDLADVPEDPPVDPIEEVDVVEDPPLDQAPDPDVVEDPTDVPIDVPANQPPVVTVPGAQSVEEGDTLIITGISVTDPDAGSADVRINLTVGDGALTLASKAGLDFTAGDGDLDAAMTFTGSLTDLNAALASLTYVPSGLAGSADTLTVTANDLGNTGSGGSGQDTETVTLNILESSLDFRVQRGYALFEDGSATAEISVADGDYVAPTGDFFVRLVGTRLTGMGATTLGGTQNNDEWMAWVDDVDENNDTITFARPAAHDPSSRDSRVAWEIIEYRGDADDPHEMVVHERGTATIAASAATNVASAIAQPELVGNDNDVVVFITGQAAHEDGSTSQHAGFATAEWMTAGCVRCPRFTRETSPAIEATISYAVVEFTGSAWTVFRLEHDYATTGAETETFGTAIPASRAFMHVQHRTAQGNQDESGPLASITGPSTVTLNLPNGATESSQTTVIWVVTNSQTGEGAMAVQNDLGGERSTQAGEEDTWPVGIDPIPRMDNASIMGESAAHDGTNPNNNLPPGQSVVLRLLSTSAVELKRSEAGGSNTLDYRFSVVSWPFVP